MKEFKRETRRILIGIVGWVGLIIGAVLIPYPGPGWVIVFASLAILATEYAFAKRFLVWLKKQYNWWMDWLNRQHWSVRAAGLVFTGLLFVFTVWLMYIASPWS
jgi:uncharacterized protein (TIGR02611 family)